MPKFTTESKYLKYTDISEEQDTPLTIQRVSREVLGQGQQQDEKWVLYFQEVKKGLALNTTNGKILVQMFGDEMNDWCGKKIALWVKPDVEFQGDIVSAIRIRFKKPGAAATHVNPAVYAMDLEARVQACTATKDLMAILREVSTSDVLSDEDRDALSSTINIKMAELKGQPR